RWPGGAGPPGRRPRGRRLLRWWPRGGWRWSSEVPLTFAILHGGLGGTVVGAGGAAFGQSARGDLGEHGGVVGRVREHGPGGRAVADGAVAHRAGDQLLTVFGPAPRPRGQPHAVPGEHLALVRVVQRGQLQVLTRDVAPDVELGEVRQRKHPHVFARAVPAVVQVPQLGPLATRIPLPELVAQREDPLLGPGPLLVPARTAEDRVVPTGGDRVEQRGDLQLVAHPVATPGEPAVGQAVLDLVQL